MPPTGQRPRMELRNFPSPNELSQLNNCLCEPSRAVMFPRWTDYKAVGIPIQATHWEDVFSQATAVTCCFHGVQFRRRIHQHVAPNPRKTAFRFKWREAAKPPTPDIVSGLCCTANRTKWRPRLWGFFIVETSSSFVFQDVVLTIHYTASVCVYILSAHLGSTFGMHTHSLKAPLFDDV